MMILIGMFQMVFASLKMRLLTRFISYSVTASFLAVLLIFNCRQGKEIAAC
jgi:hypothetical protein